MSASDRIAPPVTAAPVPPTPPPEPWWRRLLRAALTLALGAAGGIAADAIGVPLAWMMGAMVVTTAASMAGLPLLVPAWARQPNVAVLGVMLGSGFTPLIIQRFDDWLPTILGVAVYVTLVTFILSWYFRRIGHFDPVTAFFAGSPGGLNEMVIAGREMGGDDRTIALVHGARVLLVVMAVPFGFVVFGDYHPGSRPPIGGAVFDLPWRDALLLAGCAVVGAVGAKLLRIPAAFVIGPMIVSAAVHLTGWSDSRPPAFLVGLAQVVLGCGVGARFSGVAFGFLLRILRLSIGATLVMIGLTLAFAYALRGLAETSFEALVLALAPGGLAEMSLIALAMSIDAAFVATHHVLRIGMIVVAAPLLFRRAMKRRKPHDE